MFYDREPRQINAKGELGPVTDICIVKAQRTYLERKAIDTNPQLVQMILRGHLVDHWYYRSDQWIDQPYFVPQYLLQPYTGPSELAFPLFYGEGTYIVDMELMQITEKGIVVK